MDIETSEAIEAVRADLRRVETTLTVRIVGVESSLEAKTGASESSLRAEMCQIRHETRRHADVLFESLREDIRMIAEGLAAPDGRRCNPLRLLVSAGRWAASREVAWIAAGDLHESESPA